MKRTSYEGISGSVYGAKKHCLKPVNFPFGAFYGVN